MSETNPFFADAKKELEEYLQNRALLLKMQAADKLATLIGRLLVFILLGLLAFCVLFFLSIMAGYYFAKIVGSIEWGFAIVAGIYLLILLIFFLGRNKIALAITNSLIQLLFKNDE